MNPPARDASRRRGVRRAVVLMPNGLTLFNLFCGIYAIVNAVRGDLAAAPMFIVLGGIADVLDGRVARATGTGSRFGEELDSLVDAISFGFAPAFIMYIGMPKNGPWEWLLVFIFTSCAVMRLARFNVEQAGRKKTHFHGLPSPAAGLTLATYWWFKETPLYNQAIILFTDSKTLTDLPWHVLLRGLMALLAALMVSDVPYPAVPSIGFRSLKRIAGTLVVVGCVGLLIFRKEEFIFPALLLYVLYGVVKWAALGFVGPAATPDQIFWEAGGKQFPREDRHPPSARRTPSSVSRVAQPEPVRLDDDDEDDDVRPVTTSDSELRPPRRKRRRRGRGQRPPGSRPPGPPLPESPSGPTE
jgi:CDP-diacylglycerol--serine O-phosphatidyltransferase